MFSFTKLMHKIQFTEICYIDYDDPKFALSIINLVLVTCSVQLMDLFGTPMISQTQLSFISQLSVDCGNKSLTKEALEIASLCHLKCLHFPRCSDYNSLIKFNAVFMD